jgi:hypothetical protein
MFSHDLLTSDQVKFHFIWICYLPHRLGRPALKVNSFSQSHECTDFQNVQFIQNIL